MRCGGSGGGRGKQASGMGEGPLGVSGRLCSSSKNGSDRVGNGEVPVESVNRRLHKPDNTVIAGVSLETIPEIGAPSASSSLIEETFVEKSSPLSSHPAEGI